MELLERILALLPPKKVFELQRVSQHWKQAITASPEIQELLFLRPAPSGRPLETWEAFDAKSQQRIRIDFAYPCGLARHQLTTRQVTPTQEDANSNYPVLFLPFALNPLMERHPWTFPLPRPLMDFSEPRDSYQDSAQMRGRVRFKGTMTSLEQYPFMCLTNPATHEAYVVVTVTYRDADDALLTATAITAELCSVKLVSSTGLKVADITEWMRHGESVGRSIYEEGHDEALWRDEKWVFDEELQEWRRGSSRPPMTMSDLEEFVRELRGWRRVVCDPTFLLDVTLWASESMGLLPIVPTAEEIGAVIVN